MKQLSSEELGLYVIELYEKINLLRNNVLVINEELTHRLNDKQHEEENNDGEQR
jgi:hypothetical protein